MSEWTFPKVIASIKLRWFASIFGKNTWRFTATKCYSQFEDQKTVEPYRILWADDWSAVVVFGRGKKQTCHHLFFEDHYFYLAAGRAGNVEYFKKVRV